MDQITEEIAQSAALMAAAGFLERHQEQGKAEVLYGDAVNCPARQSWDAGAITLSSAIAAKAAFLDRKAHGWNAPPPPTVANMFSRIWKKMASFNLSSEHQRAAVFEQVLLTGHYLA
jgi:hypothetical protein